MTNKDIIEKQLEQFYNAIFHTRKAQLTIRSWCVTLIFALVTAISTGKLTLINKNQQVLIVIIPIILFWLIDSMQQSIIKIDQLKAKKLEKLIIQQNNIETISIELLYVNSSQSITLNQKIKFLIRSMILTETIIVFYLLMIIGVIIILSLFK